MVIEWTEKGVKIIEKQWLQTDGQAERIIEWPNRPSQTPLSWFLLEISQLANDQIGTLFFSSVHYPSLLLVSPSHFLSFLFPSSLPLFSPLQLPFNLPLSHSVCLSSHDRSLHSFISRIHLSMTFATDFRSISSLTDKMIIFLSFGARHFSLLSIPSLKFILE